MTAYDRCGSFQEAAQVKRSSSGSYSADPMTYDEVMESSGSSVRSALNNSVAKLARSCWASDIQERTTFHDCSIGAEMDADNNDMAYVRAAMNPNFFCPLFYVGFQLPTTALKKPSTLVSSCPRHTTLHSVIPSMVLLPELLLLLLPRFLLLLLMTHLLPSLLMLRSVSLSVTRVAILRPGNKLVLPLLR